MLSENCLFEKSTFLKKVNVLKPYESSSRMRVGEVSPKKKEVNKIGKAEQKNLQQPSKQILNR